MRLHQLRFQNILSFVDASFTCDHHLTALVGPNDAGKSNILRILDRLTGHTPRLTFPREMHCQFSKGAPAVDLVFVTEASDHHVLGSVLDGLELPSSPFVLNLSCREGALTVRAAEEHRDYSQPEGEEILKRLTHSHFIHAELRPLGPHIPIGDLLSGKVTPETRLFSLLRLTPDDLDNIIRKNPHGAQELIAAGQRLTQMLQEVWKQDETLKLHLFHHVEDTAEESVLDIMVGDASNAYVRLDRRGEGLRWFLAMMVQMREQPERDNVLCNLFLLDEPGVFLHPAGQADLRTVINDLSEKGENQVLYTTHSPFMLDWGSPHQVRIVERDKDTRASVIVDKPYHSNEVLNFWEPFRRSIGLFVGDLGLLGEKNLLVEGPSDQMIIAHLARMTRQLSGWRIIPVGNDTALALVARTCKQAERTVAVLVDGDDAGAKCLATLRRFDCADIPIHSLVEFNPRPKDDVPFCIEEFLSVREYLAAANDAYAEFPWYDPVEEAEIQALDANKPLTTRLETLFENRKWRDDKPHEFNKTYVSVHLASSRRPIALDDLDGKFSAIEERLSAPHGLIALGVTESPAGEPHTWSTTFSLAVKRDVGVKRIVIDTESYGDKTQLIFPPGRTPPVAAAAPAHPPVPQPPDPQPPEKTDPSTSEQECRVAEAPSSPSRGLLLRIYDRIMGNRRPSEETKLVLENKPVPESKPVPEKENAPDNPSHQNQEQSGTADHTHKPSETTTAPDALAVFDCWARKWIGAEKTFLKSGAAVVQIKGSPALERAHYITFTVEYADGSSEPFGASFSPYKPTVSAETRFAAETLTGTIVNGIVGRLAGRRKGFWVQINGYGADAFVHVSQIPYGKVGKYHTQGKPITAKYIGVSHSRLQLSLIGVKQK